MFINNPAFGTSGEAALPKNFYRHGLRYRISTASGTVLWMLAMGVTHAAHAENSAADAPAFGLVAGPVSAATAATTAAGFMPQARLLRSPMGPQVDGSPLPDGPPIAIAYAPIDWLWATALSVAAPQVAAAEAGPEVVSPPPAAAVTAPAAAVNTPAAAVNTPAAAVSAPAATSKAALITLGPFRPNAGSKAAPVATYSAGSFL